MMQGEFKESNQIVIPLTLRGEYGREEQVNVILDTGFTGFLIVPGYVVRRLNLP